VASHVFCDSKFDAAKSSPLHLRQLTMRFPGEDFDRLDPWPSQHFPIAGFWRASGGSVRTGRVPALGAIREICVVSPSSAITSINQPEESRRKCSLLAHARLAAPVSTFVAVHFRRLCDEGLNEDISATGSTDDLLLRRKEVRTPTSRTCRDFDTLVPPTLYETAVEVRT